MQNLQATRTSGRIRKKRKKLIKKLSNCAESGMTGWKVILAEMQPPTQKKKKTEHADQLRSDGLNL